MMDLAPHAINLQALFEGIEPMAPDVEVTDITTHAQRAQPGGLFLACAGARAHGLEFLDVALRQGVSAVIWEQGDFVKAPQLPEGVSGFSVADLSGQLGVIADRFFQSPSAALTVTGVTGTNGKSTTAFLVAQALGHMHECAGYMGTLGYGLPDGDLTPSSLTTPDCVSVHRRLREMLDAGARHVIAEVSSHALDQGRVSQVHFRVAALTNLTRDHLDYHGSVEEYAEAKAKLFVGSGISVAVINVGDRFGAQLADRLEPETELISVVLVDTDESYPDVRLRGMLTGNPREGLGLQLSGDFGDAFLESSLWGRFNAENLVVATGMLLGLGYPLDQSVDALSLCASPPGRMEVVSTSAGQPAVVIDFAHTPDALGQALRAVRDHCDGALWCVFGCGGDRDAGKRALMGAAATMLADVCIITDDNPRTEDPAEIVGHILAGAKAGAHLEVVHDRATAIGYAIHAAKPEDVVLVAGKGHEIFQEIDNEKVQFSDAVVARAALGLKT
jgi:UDP-N-acetylmuramoyl-L-alanyl-D-glutamate--2,6-diaminopimelate ligase